ncbi:PhoH family protein [Clostridium sp.]|uniref:PhoH family protein n=1 Tax=Clostridium sp. TaxID=1506 RepID=UPI002FCCB033
MESRIKIDEMDDIVSLFGKFDENIKVIEGTFNVTIVNRGSEVKIVGDSGVDGAAKTIIKLLEILKRKENINLHTVNYIISLVLEENESLIDKVIEDVILVTPRGKYIKCKTTGQKQYIDAIKKHDVVFGVGPAGTGKTYLAIAMAVKMLKERKVGKIILTRPAVEAGEKLGFLPGDLQEKIDPYLRPLYDALYETLGPETFQKYMESGIIEVAPLAYMRGRTLDDSFIILDEAQNTTPEQMKMFLTRFGYGSRIVITGDVTQIDLGIGKISGLKQAVNILRDVEEIKVINFTHKDVVRHRLVMEIIKAYEKFDERKEKEKEEATKDKEN